MRSATVGWLHTVTESVVVQPWRDDYITRYGHRGMSADADASPIRNAFGELWRDLAHVGLSGQNLQQISEKYLDFDFFRFPEKI